MALKTETTDSTVQPPADVLHSGSSSDSDSDEGTTQTVPTTDSTHPGASGAAQGDAAAAAHSKQTRSEKKARKSISKLGLKPVPGINRVTIRKAKSVLFIIAEPEVFKAPASDTYIVFGEAKIDDLSAQAQVQAAERLKSSGGAPNPAPTSQFTVPQQPTVAEESEEEGEIDDSGLESKDIELIMQQANVSRRKAVQALRENDNDMVNAIMSLTM
jgi:nascent polypeptide-associated complex subunit alpha